MEVPPGRMGAYSGQKMDASLVPYVRLIGSVAVAGKVLYSTTGSRRLASLEWIVC